MGAGGFFSRGQGAAATPCSLIPHKMLKLTTPLRIPCQDIRSDIRYFRIFLSGFAEFSGSTALLALISGVFFYPAGVLFYRAGVLFYPGWILFYPAGVFFYPGWILFYPAGVLFYPGGVLFYPGGVLFYPGGVLFYRAGVLFYRAGVFYYCAGVLEYRDGILLDRAVVAFVGMIMLPASKPSFWYSKQAGTPAKQYCWYSNQSTGCPVTGSHGEGTEVGVRPVATCAENIKQKSHDTPSFHTHS